MESAPPVIAATICTYERYGVLPKAVESLRRQTLDSRRYKILVVDNSPDHRRAEVFGNRFAAIKNLSYLVETTPGLSNARNLAARVCGTPFIAFLDDDAVASKNWLQAILNAFGAFGPAAVVVGGRVDPRWGAPRPPWLHDSLLGHISVVDWGGEMRVAEPEEWFAGTNIAFRTSAILGNGGFATHLGRVGSGAALSSNEEQQLLHRLRAAGGKLIYAPEVRIDHLVDAGRLTRAWFRKRSAWQAASDFAMHPERLSRDARKHWQGTIGFFNKLPPHERTVRGLLADTDDPELFRDQLGAIYMMTALLLAGFEGVVLD